MRKHTPGRWHWWTSCSWKRLRSEDGMKTHDVVVPYVARSDGHPDLMVSEADMRLIAAAPEILEALRYLRAFPNATKAHEFADAAIAKARGS